MRNIRFYHDEQCMWHSATTQYAGILPVGKWVQPASNSGLAESPESKRRFKNLIEISNLNDRLEFHKGILIDEVDLLRIHTQDYIDRFKKMSDEGGGELGPIGDATPIGPGSYEIAKISAGLATAAIQDVWLGKADAAYALSRPPGHHALPDQALGFCLLANIPIAIEYCRAHHNLGKVLILDWDVHHGNGAQLIYYEDPNTYTISIHQENCYPIGYRGDNDRGKGAGKGYNLNIPLPAGAGHDAYLQVFDSMVLPEIKKYKPDMIIVASGFDANILDPLARMSLYSESYYLMMDKVLKVAKEVCNGKVVAIHEGGYSESYVPFCGIAVLEALVGERSDVIDPMIEFCQNKQPSEEVARFLKQYIDKMSMKLK